MRTTTSVIAFAIVSIVASVAEAQWATPPSGWFGSGANYVMGNSDCSVLNNVTVKVKITQDLIAQSTTCGGVVGNNGFSFQLNANTPHVGSLTDTQTIWHQYVIDVSPTEFTSHTQLWAHQKGDGMSIPDQNIRAVPSTATIPAGWTLKWSLDTDSAGNVVSATYTVTDQNGIAKSVTQSVGSAYMAPIGALQLDLVGWANGCAVTFQQGAGQITYKSTTSSFTAQSSIPSCGNQYGTGESSPNSVYGLLPSGSSTSFSQNFYISPYALQKTPINLGGGTASPTVLGDSSSPISLSSVGFNAVTLAPGSLWDMSWLSNAESSTGNAQQNQCSYSALTGTICNLTTGIYNWGLAMGTDNSLFGWTLNGGVWLNNLNTHWGDTGSYTSVAPITASNVFLTNAQDSSCASTGSSSGPCIYHSSGSTPGKWNNFGATQVAVDSLQTTTDLFSIDAATNTVYDISTGSAPTATALPTYICGGGTLVADQIAVKGGVAFAIQDNQGDGGWLYAYSSCKPACPDGSGVSGWTRVGTKAAIESIATDQVGGMAGPGSNQGCAVWGTDAKDQEWCAVLALGDPCQSLRDQLSNFICDLPKPQDCSILIRALHEQLTACELSNCEPTP